MTQTDQLRETVEQHPVNVEETHALYDSLYQNLAIQVQKVNTVNRKLKETNAELTTELVRFKNQEKFFEISQEKYDKLERCYQRSVYQEQCLSKKINALHLSSGKQIMTLNEEISNLNKQLSKEKSIVSFLLKEKKKLKSDFKIREDELLDKQIQLEKKIKELDNILVKTGQSIQTIHMLLPKPDSFYHTEQKMALGYQNTFYLKQAQKKQQKADESVAKHKALELEIKRLLRPVISQDIMSIVQKASVVDTSNLQTELERTKKRFENCIIKKENEYAKLWNDWYKKCEECKFDKISYGLPKFKYHKEHLCPSCDQGKSKRASHPPKPVLNSRQRLHLLYMDLCGPTRITSIKGKRITVLLQSPVIIIRTENGKEFKNQAFKEYFDSVGISHQMSYVRTPQQNEVVERRNQTLVEAARTMLIFLMHRYSYGLKKPDISFLHVFGALCYPKNDHEDIGKLGAKGLDLTYAPSTITTQQPSEGKLDLLFEAMYDDFIGGQLSAAQRTVPVAQAQQVRQTSTISTSIAETTPTPTNSSSQPTIFLNTSQDCLILRAYFDILSKSRDETRRSYRWFYHEDSPLPRVTQVSIAGTTSTEQPPMKDKSMWSDQEKRVQKIDRLARSLLIQGLPNDIYSLIDSNKTAKDLWDALARHMLGSEYGEQDRKAAVLYEYETFKAIEWNCCLTLTRDVNDAIGSKKKTVVVTSDPLALIAEKTDVSRSKEKVVVSSDSERSEADDFSELKKITALLAKAFNQRKFYSKPTNNNLGTSSSSQSANKKQEFVKTDNKRVEKKDNEKKRDMSRFKCYNCKKEGHFAKDCKKAKVKDYEYYQDKDDACKER
nr:hypothetical protein [Tanacetum cinerariifolium]